MSNKSSVNAISDILNDLQLEGEAVLCLPFIRDNVVITQIKACL